MTPKTRLVEVTADDIVEGKVDTLRCPIALALCRSSGSRPGTYHLTRTRRNGRWVGVVTLDNGVQFRLSPAVGRFMTDFDHHRPVKPFAFRVWL